VHHVDDLQRDYVDRDGERCGVLHGRWLAALQVPGDSQRFGEIGVSLEARGFWF
jgi:hypothetical protein